MRGNRYTPAMLAVVSATWALSLVALLVLRRRRERTVLDLWLMVVMVAWLFDVALSAVLNAGRFDLGFYAGRIYGLLAASFVLAMLLLENGKLYARLVESNARAEAANQAKSDFLSRMSHELRTPLNAVLGFGQLLGRRAEDPRDRESVEQILKGGRHLLSLINEVLDLARIESGRLSLSPEPVQIAEAVSRTLDLARPLAAERRITLRADAARTGPRYVLADTQRLHQVLLNLVANAIKYNRDGGDVTVGCAEAGAGRLRFVVTDTGAGIPPALQARLFTPFDRLGAETGPVEGTGLGLVLAKRLVEAMGGVIGVESVEGRGSTFWLELPEAASPEENVRRRAAAPATLAAARGGTVLYIEDNAANVRLVETILAERPAIRFISAMQGRLGLDLARQHRPSVILADLHLPDISGEDVLREVRADPALRDIPVIILSADATPGQISRLLAAGARAYLTKPLDVQELLAKIDAWCAGQESEPRPSG
jgi:signal transduction histidine kinase/ActR/RegA family two-component response regulator